jgi:mRNA-degrading endonuclease RelE of RelBE toxin-antitoxin system
MYQVQYSDKILGHLTAANKVSPSISERLQQLEDNPLARAKETGIETIGTYYINAGRYCILFEIHEEEQIVEILSVRRGAYIHKLLRGIISE